MVRKPFEWREVDEDFITHDTHLEVFSADELGVYDNPSHVFSIPTPPHFILVRDNKKYAVKTEGFNSVRYIQRIG